MKTKSFICYLVLTFILLVPSVLKGQITAPGAAGTAQTEYPVFNETDNIYVFCVSGESEAAAALEVSTELEGTKTFVWDQYNNTTGEFEFYFSESTEAGQSEISGLEDGGYRVTITQGETTTIYRAWVFNNWFSASAAVTESNCESFKLDGSFISSGMRYYDLANNSELDVFKDVKVEWKEGEAIISRVQTTEIFNPPTEDTEYTLRVYDRFGCETTTTVTYESIVTEAKFSVDFGEQAGNNELEAPLTVSFINESENGDTGLYEWFFYRDLDEIKREAENTDQPIDSIDFVAYDQNPLYTYENTGTYMVKLVSKNVSEFHTCVDTFYMPDYIVIEPSFIEAPNVFTPNGDDVNDVFAVKFWSMQSIKISIFNRWGKRIHFWESDDVRGFEGTHMETVWDGRIGGRYASPGVYYYVVEGMGRDGERRTAHDFFHLFREKD